MRHSKPFRYSGAQLNSEGGGGTFAEAADVFNFAIPQIKLCGGSAGWEGPSTQVLHSGSVKKGVKDKGGSLGWDYRRGLGRSLASEEFSCG